MKDIAKILNELAKDFVLVFQEALASKAGINQKVGRNTLINSNVFNQIESNSNGKDMIRLYVNSYIDYIESGRRARAKRVPIKAIKDWCERKNIPSDNKTIYSIQQAIYRDGIRPRPVIEMFYELASKEWNEHLAQKLYNFILNEFTDNLIKE